MESTYDKKDGRILNYLFPDMKDPPRRRKMTRVTFSRQEIYRWSQQQKAAIFKAIKHISSLCDGAYDRDGQGFNKNDTELGKSLATLNNMSIDQLRLAAMLCYKYRGQLPENLKMVILSLKT